MTQLSLDLGIRTFQEVRVQARDGSGVSSRPVDPLRAVMAEINERFEEDGFLTERS